jgi:hypothetical protein
MSLIRGKTQDLYDFSGGINLEHPAHLIDDTECFASIPDYDKTLNIFWDRGIKSRGGTLKVNTYEGFDFIDRGDCESATPPMLTGETVPVATVNGTWARSGVQKYTGSYSWLLTKTTAGGAGEAICYLCDTSAVNDMHGLVAGNTYKLHAHVYSDVVTPSQVSLVLLEYYAAS